VHYAVTIENRDKKSIL